MEKLLKDLIEKTKNSENLTRPLFFRLKSETDKKKLHQLIEDIPGINIYDEILGQAEEYVKCKNPRRVFSKQELTEAAKEYIGAGPREEFGVWVYYPWSKRLVHILDEEEFVEVRTNRNQYKITPEEKAILSKKKIGVIGLSVGQSIALTLAMERSFGELRIADFDILELSNLNRIRTGVHNLGTAKTVAVAREIAEIDPYLDITCFHEGATENNLDTFITANGKLDVLVDECDGLLLKILCRQAAKKHRIPVVMDTSDRGMVDVERFDLEPDRTIFHGLIDHLDISKVKEAKTNEEKVPYLLPMLGIDTVSNRMRASMLEIEQTITTWPQLASSVVMGGGLGADVCRRILLDQFHDSGRYFVDVEEIISDKEKREVVQQEITLHPALSDQEMLRCIQDFKLSPATNQLDLKEETIRDLVKAATQAPSGANGQPWQWMYHNKTLYLFLELIYEAALLDCKKTISLVGLGCAAENLVLKAHELGLEVLTDVPNNLTENSKLISAFRFFEQKSSPPKAEPHVCDELAEEIPNRITNRVVGKRQFIPHEKLQQLRDLARTIEGADLILIEDEKQLAQLRDLTGKMDRIRMMHEGGQKDLRAEIRWTPEEAERMRNGVDLVGTVDLTASELAGWQMVKDWKVVKLLNDWHAGTGFEKIQRKWVDGSSALGLLVMPHFSHKDFYIGGRALERAWLLATKLGIEVHPASISTLIFNTLKYGDDILPPAMKTETANLREEFLKIFSLPDDAGLVLLLRFFTGGKPKAKALRYEIDSVLRIHN